MPRLVFQPLQPGTDSWLGGAPDRGRCGNALHQRLQPPQRLIAVLLLVAEFLRLDDNDAFFGNTLVVQLQQALLEFIRQ